MAAPSKKSKSRFGKIKWFTICLLFMIFAILLWPGPPMEDVVIFIPFDLEKTTPGLIMTDTPLKGIEVRVRGAKSKIKTLQNLKLKYPLDLSGLQPGVQYIPVDKKRIRLPKDIAIIMLNPPYLTVRIENEIKKTVPLEVSFSGKPVKGFMVANAIVKPDKVVLAGPESTLTTVEKIHTKPIDVNGISESFKKEITLDLPEGLKVILPPESILADVSVEEKITTMIFSHIPITGRGTHYQYRITPAQISIEVKGPLNTLEKLHTEKSIRVYVDLKGLKPGVYVRRAVIELPLKTTLAGVKPEVFTVKITR